MAVSSSTAARYRSAARDYVRASGGAGRAARSARSGKAAAVALGGFLSTAAGQGFGAALGRIGITWVVGRDVSEVLSAISNALSPDGASKEEAAAREAINETLEHLCDRFLAEGRDLTALEAMTPVDIAAAIERCVEAYVYNRWLGDLGVKIEEKAISPAEAVRLERDMKGFVHETVRFDLSQVDVINLDWQGEAGRALVDNIYRDAYSLFGGER